MLSSIAPLLANGFTAFTFNLSFNAATATKEFDLCRWKSIHAGNALQHSEDSHNAVVIKTEPSNLIVVDVDALKPDEVGKMLDGMQLFDELVHQHGLPDNTPCQTTGSGGKHYFFSLSKSLAQGLHNDCNRSKVVINGQHTTIDVRARSGLIIVAPTSYMAGDTRRTYEFQVPLGPSADIDAMPAWLINLMNQADTAKVTNIVKRKHATQLTPGNQNITSLMRQVKPRLETEIGNTIDRMYDRTEGMDFNVTDRNIACTICGCVHTSNSWKCRIILEDCCSLRNYSTSCFLKVLDYRRQPILRRVLENPCVDDPFVMILTARMNAGGKMLRVTGHDRQFYCFTDHHWETVPETTIQQEMRFTSFDVINTLCIGLAGAIKQARRLSQATEELQADLKQFAKGKAYIQKSGNVRAITESAKQLLWDEDLMAKLDTNPDLLGVADGVIDLQTGALRAGRPDDYIATHLEIHAQDCLQNDTPIIDTFFNDIFNSDQELISYMQRLLGYGITGHTREQVWTIWTGSGSNGKSLLLAVLAKLLRPFWFVMPREVLFDTGRKQAEGGPTPHLMTLIGKRIGVREEKNSDAVLNEEVIKSMTGQSDITGRDCHDRKYKTFTATHLPILVCNIKPPVDCDDDAMLRRILVLAFKNVYTTGSDIQRPYDPTNPHHRIKDPNKLQELTTPEAQRQLLAWLVKGAKQWYGNGLGPQPAAMRAEFQGYVEDNDKLTAFINSSCTRGEGLHVNAGEFRAAFMEETGQRIKQSDLQKAMAKRDCPYKSVWEQGRTVRVYRGLQLGNLQSLPS